MARLTDGGVEPMLLLAVMGGCQTSGRGRSGT